MSEMRPPYRSSGRSGPVAPPGPSRHLLIVDDDDRIRELLMEYLTREGYRTTWADASTVSR